MSAMDSEINRIIPLIEQKIIDTKGGRSYYTGTINNIDVVVAKSEIGKVASAITTTTMIETFGINQLIFTGVAGTPDKNVKIGDLIIATELFQHDMDCSPLYEPQVIPVLNKKFFKASEKLNQILIDNKDLFLKSLQSIQNKSNQINLNNINIFTGIIASGDQFINSSKDAQKACNNDMVLALEMEGAAVAHVCHDYNIPYCVIRAISDNANSDSEVDFMHFVEDIASYYSQIIIELYTKELH